jgi:hypothetical protein
MAKVVGNESSAWRLKKMILEMFMPKEAKNALSFACGWATPGTIIFMTVFMDNLKMI